MPVGLRKCKDSESEANKAKVKATKNYRGVPNVIVKEHHPDGKRITISARGVDHKLHDHVIEWGDENVIWPYCPSTLPSEAAHPNPGPRPAPKSSGMLFLEDDFIKKAAILGGTPKWPSNLPGSPLAAPLSIAPESLVLHGFEQADNGIDEPGTVDLMDRTLAPPQTIVIGDGPIEVQLTQNGFKKFRVAFPSELHLPEAIRVILERKDPALIADAWQIVAACKQLVDADQWATLVADRPGAPKLEEAKSLLGKVLEP